MTATARPVSRMSRLPGRIRRGRRGGRVGPGGASFLQSSLQSLPGPAPRRAPAARPGAQAALALLLALLLPAGAWANDPDSADARIVTAIDMSDSVLTRDLRAELSALAAAMRSPGFLSAVQAGSHGRVAFAVFGWHTRTYEILPWTPIATRDEAEAAARRVEARVAVDPEAEARSAPGWSIGRLTDLSRALDHAREMAAPEGAPLIVNVIGNGRDNIGEAALPARDRLLAMGATVNGIVFHGSDAVVDYFLSDVAGGLGSFVMTAAGVPDLVAVMRRKLVLDVVAAR